MFANRNEDEKILLLSKIALLTILTISSCQQDQGEALMPSLKSARKSAMSDKEAKSLTISIKQDADFKSLMIQIRKFEKLIDDKKVKIKKADVALLKESASKSNSDAEIKEILSDCFTNEGLVVEQIKATQEHFAKFVLKYPSLASLDHSQLAGIFGNSIKPDNSKAKVAGQREDCVGTCSGAYNAQTEANETALLVNMVACAGFFEIPVIVIGCVSSAFIIFGSAQDANLANLGACTCGCGYLGGCS